VTDTIVFVLKGYPRLSETFIAQEIAALENRGVSICIVSLRYPTDKERHPIHNEIVAPVRYLPENLYYEPLRVFRAWLRQRENPNFQKAVATWWRDFKRDPFSNRLRHFGQAIVLIDELEEGCRHLHAHFLHTPASVTRYAALLSGLSWSCSAHAKDIWTTPDWEKAEKLGEMDWLVTCTEVGRAHLATLAPDKDRVELVYHGLDFARFAEMERPANFNEGSNAADPLTILSVGRAVPKKGYDVLLRALSQLPKELHWRFEHIGGGMLLDALQEQAKKLGIDDKIAWHGAQAQTAVLSACRDADIFVLASRITENGDRDGLPNVLLEAQSQGLPCVSTRVSAIPELILDGETGLLVPQEDEAVLAEALEALITDPPLRHRLGQGGFNRVRDVFSHEAGAERIAGKFGQTMDLNASLRESA
jgi:glycosyltransferase involved in cell wall biosynthesis